MSSFIFADFTGIAPARSHKLIPKNVGQVAHNVYLESGELSPLYKPLRTQDLAKAGTIRSLYLLRGSWLHWAEDVDVVPLPVRNSMNRIAYTGTDVPRVTDSLISLGDDPDDTAYPINSFRLGVPTPRRRLESTVGLSPTVGLQFSWNIAGLNSDPFGGRVASVYVYTYVNQWGEEGPPSPPSDIVYAGAEYVPTLLGFYEGSLLVSEYGITHIRLYRSVSGSNLASAYLLVAEVEYTDIADGARDLGFGYADRKTASELGESLSSQSWGEPINSLSGIISGANGFLAGFAANQVFFCEPYKPHAWPEQYAQTFDAPIVGLASIGNSVLVMTRGFQYVLTGNHPSILTLIKLEHQLACVSKRSIVEIAHGAIYASSEGLIQISNGVASVITEGVYSRRDWKDLNPSTIHGYFYRGKYVGFADTDKLEGSFQFDLRTKEFTTTSIKADSGFSNLASGELFLSRYDGSVNELILYDGDRQRPLEMTWRSKALETTRINVVSVRVSARGYPVRATLFVDGDKKQTLTIDNAEPRRFPTGYVGRVIEIEVTSFYSIYSVSISDDVDSLK